VRISFVQVLVNTLLERKMATGLVGRDAALQFLWNRINYERTSNIPYRSGEFKLDRMRELLRRLGDPHVGLRCVHVAGTKGKGSTAAMLAAIAQSAGLKTGLYTSPHLQKVEERFVVDGKQCSETEFVELIALIQPVVEAMDTHRARNIRKPTFFEITTAMGLLHFARCGVDLAVVEVGLGGRLDSTNVISPDVSVITSISFDHTRQLGSDLASIAREKAGIIKPQTPVVSGVVDEEPAEVIEQVAQQNGSLLRLREHDFFAEHVVAQPDGRVAFNYRGASGFPHLPDLATPLLGDHQAQNAAVALAAIEVLNEQGWSFSKRDARAGLAAVTCPARIEFISSRPPVVVDAAHNLASIKALLSTLPTIDAWRTASRRTLIFGAAEDKDIAGMLGLILKPFDRVVFAQSTGNARSATPQAISQLAQSLPGEAAQNAAAILAESPEAAHRLLASAAPDEFFCITGSFFLAAEMRAFLDAAERI